MEETTPKPAGFNMNIFTGKGLTSGLPFPKLLSGLEEGQNQPPTLAVPPAHLLGNPLYFRLKLADVWLPNEPLITLTGSKVVIKTPISGGNGTVKEMIGEDDYRINIKGEAVRESSEYYVDAGGVVPDEYPQEWMRAFARLWKINTDIPCQCQLLSYFNISRCVIEDITFPPVPGKPGSFYYEINAVSDESSVAKLIRK